MKKRIFKRLKERPLLQERQWLRKVYGKNKRKGIEKSSKKIGDKPKVNRGMIKERKLGEALFKLYFMLNGIDITTNQIRILLGLRLYSMRSLIKCYKTGICIQVERNLIGENSKLSMEKREEAHLEILTQYGMDKIFILKVGKYSEVGKYSLGAKALAKFNFFYWRCYIKCLKIGIQKKNLGLVDSN